MGIRKYFKVIVPFLLLISTLAFGENGYYIKNYNIAVNINEENDYFVNEEIETVFQNPKRGIIRSIPTLYGDRNLKLSDIKVTGAPYSEKFFSSGVNLRIGDPDRYITGEKTYDISYRYSMGWDRINDYDEVYYNLIGNEWDTTIQKVEFRIDLPKTFDSKKINFTLGNYGSRDNSGVVWKVEGESIIGYTTRPLRPGEALTLALPLPEGYFEVYRPIILLKTLSILTNILAIFLPLLGIYLWMKYGKNDPLVEPVEFYPPENMNPAELGYYIDGRIDAKDITSLIIYWADRGYITIKEIGKSGLFTKKDYILEKKKEMEERNSYEPFLFKGMFMFSPGSELNLSSLKNRFYPYIEKCARLLKIDLVMKGTRLYTPESLRMGNIIKSLSLILLILPLIYYSVDRDINIISPEMVGGIISIPFNFPLAFAGIFILIIVGIRCRKRTSEYSSLLGRIKGFKNFLLLAEKPKLEALVDENTQYFYNILPYTIVLGVSDKWAEKFKDLVKAPPSWYQSSSTDLFTMALFMNAFNGTLNSMENSMYSVPPSNRGPGISSGGGGSAGGGAGGGGGSSW